MRNLLLLSMLMIFVFFLGCSDSNVIDPAENVDLSGKLTTFYSTQSYTVEEYAALHDAFIAEKVNYSYEECWDEMPTVLGEIAHKLCPEVEPHALQLSLAVVDLLGSPEYAKTVTRGEAMNILEKSLEGSEKSGEIGTGTKTAFLSVFQNTGKGPEVDAEIQALVKVTNLTGNEYEKQLVGNLLGSWQYWNSSTDKVPADPWVGTGLDAAFGLIPVVGRFIGPAVSLNYALYCEYGGGPEWDWGGTGHWGTHHK